MRIYISGISGTGMGPLALMAKSAGFEVCGSDLAKGAIYDEYPSYADTIYYWTGNGFVSNDRINEFLDYIDDEYREFYPLLKPLFENNTERSYIRSIPGKDCQFVYETNIPNVEWFDVMEDDDLYCKGFVFKKDDLKA